MADHAHDHGHDEVLDAMTKVAGQIRLGSGLDPDTTMGPLVSLEQQRRVEDIGRELGPYALDAYLETKQIYINLGE
jgi:acyl-CoA reductase-like NAD-dependent aldehyde dehydrogenase